MVLVFMEGRTEKGSTIEVCSLYQVFKFFLRLPNYFTMFHWPEFGYMATARCKGGWEIKHLALTTSIVKVVKERYGWQVNLWSPGHNENGGSIVHKPGEKVLLKTLRHKHTFSSAIPLIMTYFVYYLMLF